MSTLKTNLLILLVLLLAACSAVTETASPTPSVSPVTETAAPPTATSIPMAFTVNNEGISLEEFDAELARYRQSQTDLGRQVEDEKAKTLVINDLISQLLLAQGAREAGFSLDEAALQERIDSLTVKLGGAEALSAWQNAHGYDDAGFRLALKRSAESAWMRDKIISALPSTAEQVHVRQILTYNQEDADRAFARLQAGADFDELAALYDPATRGDIGWFPRGYLEWKVIEDTAFSLEVNTISAIVPSEIGFHILKVIERQEQRPLAFDAQLALQNRALTEWVERQRSESKIVILLAE